MVRSAITKRRSSSSWHFAGDSPYRRPRERPIRQRRSSASSHVCFAPIVFSNESRAATRMRSGGSALGCLCSLRARRHLKGSAGCRVAWLKPQSAYGIGRMLQNRRHHLHPPSGDAPLGSSFRPPVSIRADVAQPSYAALNSVPCRSMACMMMASLRASAIRAFRIVERWPMASAQLLRASSP
jgi:hypothetical protein